MQLHSPELSQTTPSWLVFSNCPGRLPRLVLPPKLLSTRPLGLQESPSNDDKSDLPEEKSLGAFNGPPDGVEWSARTSSGVAASIRVSEEACHTGGGPVDRVIRNPVKPSIRRSHSKRSGFSRALQSDQNTSVRLSGSDFTTCLRKITA
jgi:hypothetical protein